MEVRSETGLISSREPLPFTVSHQKTTATNPVVHTQQPQLQNMRLAFAPDGTALYKQVPTSTSPSPPVPPSYQNTTGGGGGDGGVQQPISGGHGGLNMNMNTSMNMNMNMNMNMGEPVKRKRGRPRKYGPDGTMALALLPVSSHSAPPSTHLQSPSSGGGGFSSPTGVVTSPSGSALTGIKKRGRPPGSGKKQQLASLGSIGTKFTPHIITVKAGEDISSMIISFLQHGPRAVCVLSANGAISNVTLRQASMSGGTVTYEGRFEILSLSGSFLLSETGGQRSRTGGLSVSLAGPDGRVLGGGVAGPLTAASPVQVVVGSFIAKVKKEPKKLSPLESISATKLPSVVNPGGTGSPNSRGTLSESSNGPGSPLNQSTGGCSNGSQQAMPSMPWK